MGPTTDIPSIQANLEILNRVLPVLDDMSSKYPEVESKTDYLRWITGEIIRITSISLEETNKIIQIKSEIVKHSIGSIDHIIREQLDTQKIIFDLIRCRQELVRKITDEQSETMTKFFSHNQEMLLQILGIGNDELRDKMIELFYSRFNQEKELVLESQKIQAEMLKAGDIDPEFFNRSIMASTEILRRATEITELLTKDQL